MVAISHSLKTPYFKEMVLISPLIAVAANVFLEGYRNRCPGFERTMAECEAEGQGLQFPSMAIIWTRSTQAVNCSWKDRRASFQFTRTNIYGHSSTE